MKATRFFARCVLALVFLCFAHAPLAASVVGPDHEPGNAEAGWDRLRNAGRRWLASWTS